jgi:hypothetical protein
MDRSYRPHDYFWAARRGIQLASDIKGAGRRQAYELALENGDDLDPIYSKPSLSADFRAVWSGIHPSLMGGEYLRERQKLEVEIARIVIRSSTYDVTCVYALPLGRRIQYRIVDEYDGETLSEPVVRISNKPLTQGALINFFLQGWDLLGVLEYNFGAGYPEDDVLDFIEQASSDFYPDFGALVRTRVYRWLGGRLRELGRRRSVDPPC